jgi:hypothetical protein
MRVTAQSLEIVKSFSGSEYEQDNRCSPDAGIESAPGSITTIVTEQSACLNGYGPAWAEGRPMTDRLAKIELLPFRPSCVPIPCTSDPIIYRYINPASILDAVEERFDAPPKIAYRATKDTFQSMFVRFGLKSNAASPKDCITTTSKVTSYFRYSERHYYFGYDRNTDEYRIYSNSPDFLREVGGLDYSPEIDNEPGNTYYPVGCTLCGFGGATGPNDGSLAGTSGYYSLYNYPLTGPNYGIELSVEIPLFSITTPQTAGLQRQIEGIVCDDTTLTPGGRCSPCGGAPGGGIVANMDSFVGAGGAMYYSCQRGNACAPGDGCNPQGGYSRLFNVFYYRRGFRTILSGRTLLFGVDSAIDKEIDPALDPNFVRKTFLDVLNDSSLTQKETPWFYPNSTKWMPLCWESPLIFPAFENETGTISNTILYPSVELGDYNINILYTEPPANDDPNETGLYGFNPNEFEEIELVSFLSENNFPNVSTLKKGVFKFELKVRAEQESTSIALRFKIFKMDVAGNVTELTNTYSDYSEYITGTNSSNEQEYTTLFLTDYILSDITLNPSDRLLFTLYGKQILKETQSPPYVNAIEIKFNSNELRIYYSKFGDVLEGSPCFAGSVNENVFENLDPNTVDIVINYDENGNKLYLVYTTPINCNLVGCCPTG